MRWIRTAALAGGLLLATLAASGRADDAPDEKTGLKVGTKAPAFILKDQNGKERSLDEFLKKGKVALVFFRSAGW
jgi:cytochrome oxidase Cu insertion factor (SCO1/SenC/PrrC family)